MLPRRAYLETAFTTALALWLGVVLMTGVAAARTFTIIKNLEPTLGKYPNYTGEHWRIAAGKVVNTVFWWSDVAQVICLVAAIAALLALTLQKHIPVIAAVARWACVAVLLAILVYHLLVLGPRMSANLSQYWEAAAAGDNTRAEVFQAAFNADHPRARNALTLTAVSLALSLIITAWTLTRENGLPRLFAKKAPTTSPAPAPAKPPSAPAPLQTSGAKSPEVPAKPPVEPLTKTPIDSPKPPTQ